MSLGSLNIDLNANIAKFESALDRAAYVAKTAMDKVAGAATTAETAMKGLEGALGKVGIAMGTLGLIGSVGGLIELVKSSITGAAELKHMSAQTGVSVEALSALKGVAKITGMDLETAAQGAAKLGKSMYDAQGGSEKQRQAFKNLGISYTDASGKLRPVGEVMLDVGKKLLNSADGAGKAGIAIDLMGKKGATMIPILEQLALKGNINGKVTDELADRAAHLQITWYKMIGTMNSWKGDALSAIIPSLERIIPLVPKIATGLVGLFTVTKVLPMAISAVTTTITTLASVTSASGLIGLGVFSKLRTAVIALNAAVLANPFVAITAAILAAGAALYVFQDKLVSIGGATASIGNWIGGVWDVIKAGSAGAWAAIKDAFGKASAWISETFGGLKDLLGKFFGWAVDIAKSYANGIIGAHVGVLNAAIIVFDALKNAWKNALDWMSGLGKDFGEGVAAALHGDVAFAAFRKRLADTGSAAVQVGAQVKGAMSDALNTDYVGKAASAYSNVFERIKRNALRRKATDDAERKDRDPDGDSIQNKSGAAAAAANDPFRQAMQDLQRQAVGMQYVVDNFDKFSGKVRDSKVAMAEFDVTLGKFSDTERAAAKLPPLSVAQKEAYKAAMKAVEDLEQAEKRLMALKKFDDSVKKMNEETAGLKESAVAREIAAQMAQLEAAGIKKGTDEYINRQKAVGAAIQSRKQVEFGKDMTEYFAQQKIGIANENFMISLLGRSSLEVAKLTEAHRIDAEVQEKIRQADRDGVKLNQQDIADLKVKAEGIKQVRMAQIDLAAAIQRTPEFGAHEAIRKYQEAANDAGTQVENTMTNALKGVEDAFVQLSTTGKLSFKSLADSIVADVARMGFKKLISEALGYVQGGGMGSTLAGLFGTKSGNAAGSVASAATGVAKTASDAATSASSATAVTALSTAATASSTALTTMSASVSALDTASATLTAGFGTLAAAAETASAALTAAGAGNAGSAVAGAGMAATDATSSATAAASLTALGTAATTGAAAMSAMDAATTAGSASLTAMTASSTALDAVSTTLAATFAALVGAAQAAAAALASVVGSSGGAGIGALAGAVGGGASTDVGWEAMLAGAFAGGGDPPVGRPSLVGEEGPEIFVPKTAGTILPNDVFKNAGSGGDDKPQQNNVIHLNINVPQGTSRSAADQIAASTGMAVNRALRRNA